MAIPNNTNMIIDNEVVKQVAIDAIADNLKNAEAQTGGAIVAGRNIHKGDFLETTLFDQIGNVVRRDPTDDSEATPDRIGNIEGTQVKLYFKDLVFTTFTELARYGTSMEAMSVRIGERLGEAVVRWGLGKAILATKAALKSNGDTTYQAGGTITHADLVKGIFKFGDGASKIKTLVAPATVVGNLIASDTTANPDSIAYGAVYQGMTGTINRNLWMVDAQALMENGKSTVLGLTEGAVTVDESEMIRFFTQEVLDRENAGMFLRTEGAYTLDIKGFSYDQSAGANPDDTVLGDPANWTMFVGDKRNTAGVVIESA
jgi:hypothetical protein